MTGVDLMYGIKRVRPLAVAALLLCAALPATAQRVVQAPAAPTGEAASEATSRVFRRFADRIVKIEVVETGSAAKATLGSGFFVGPAGHLVTNYHVIAKLVHDPDRYRAMLVRAGTKGEPLEILAIDVVHDLAVLRAADVAPASFFTLDAATVAQGDRLYSLGHPSDLGLSIVEGTYNGLLQHTLYPRIHFTGSINPGMSGGPTITEGGRVVGVNVSTAGNQMSFLVPAEQAMALVRRASAADYQKPDDLLAEVGAQLRENQAHYLRDMFDTDVKHVQLGRFEVATEPAPFFRCWADADRQPEQPYETVNHQCSTDDYVYIAGDQRTGIVELHHTLLTSKTLNATRFHALYSDTFGQDNTPGGSEEHVTKWRCMTRNVRGETVPLRAVLCVRRYRKFEGLYDAVLKTAVLGRARSGLVSTLQLSGVSYENIERTTDRFLRQISWH